MRAFVERMGWVLVAEHLDDGRTARTGHLDKRDALAQMLADARAKRFDVLVCVKIGRLTRSDSIEERATVLGPLQSLGIKIATPESGEPQDPRTFLGELWIMLQAMFAAEENRTRTNAITDGKTRAVAEGRKPSGRTPYGYDYDRATGCWTINEAEAEVVRYMYRRVAAGASCEQVAEELAKRGLRRPRGGEFVGPRVWKIITRRTYLGEWEALGLKIAIPPILNEALWYEAQEHLGRHKLRGLRKTRHVYLLEGLAFCDLCEARILIASGCMPRNRKKMSAATYLCAQRRRPERGCAACELRRWKVTEADARLWQVMRSKIEEKDFVERVISTRADNAAAARTNWANDLRVAEAKLARLAIAEAAILERFSDGMFSAEAMDVALKRTMRERAAFELQADAARRAGAGAERAAADARALGEWVMKCRRSMATASPEDRRELTCRLVGPNRVVLGQDYIRAVARFPIGLVSPSSSSREHETDHCNYVDLALVA